MVDLGKITRNSVTINYRDRLGTCTWIKNSKLHRNFTCYCCDVQYYMRVSRHVRKA